MPTSPAPVRIRRTRPAFTLLVALCSVLALLLAACGGGDRDDNNSSGDGGDSTSEGIIDTSSCPDNGTTGVDGTTIKIGTSLPQSGLYSAFAAILQGEQAYFDYVNEVLGGVEVAGKKYQIELVDKDDEYQADKTVTNVTSLVNDDQVFALFNVVGTKNNLAIRDFVNQQCVPNLFTATGSPAWGNKEYPWLLGSELVPYPLEANAFADYLKTEKPDATVAILAASDDFGRAYTESFKQAIEGTDIKVVKEATYNAEQSDTKAQITSLASSNADALLLGATLLACPNALGNVKDSGWAPITYMSGTCTSSTLIELAGEGAEDVFTVADIMEPTNPAWDSNEQMQLYKEQLPKHEPEAAEDLGNAIVAYGWTTAALLTETLSRAPELTRSSVMETARTLEDVEDVGLLMPGVVLNVNENDWFLGESFQLLQYDLAKGYFELVGDLIEQDGQTEEFTPPALING